MALEETNLPASQEGATPPATPPAGAEPPDALSTTLDGDDVPQEFRGKTVKDLLAHTKELLGAKTRAEQETSQWRAYVAAKATEAEAVRNNPPTPVEDPLSEVDPRVLQGLQSAMNNQLNAQIGPIMSAIGSMNKNFIRGEFDDFGDYEERATQIYNQMPPAYRFDDKHGWRFAYNMAKAERATATPRKPSTHPPLAATTIVAQPTKPTLSDDQKKIAANLGLTPEEYIEYQDAKDLF